MAIINANDCFNTGFTYGVNFNGNSVNIGETWYVIVDIKNFACVEITDSTDDPTSILSAQTEYPTCYDCYSNNYGIYTFTTCDGGTSVSFDVSAFGSTFFSTFDSKKVYFINSLLNGNPIQGCFSTNGPKLLNEETYNLLQAQNLISDTVISVSGFTSCEECLTNSPLIYTVERCTTPTTFDVVQLTSNLSGKLISYTNGTDEFCGVVVGVSSSPTPTHTFVSLFPEGTACDVCLDVQNEKFIIENCANSTIQEVVWGSQLFQNGSVSNLQLGGGCYEVISVTTSAVTQTLFLDFEPQPNCQACIECHGVFYEYALCSDPLVKVGEILSYEYISGNTAFYHPTHNEFVVTLDTITANTTTYRIFYSLITKSDCTDPDPDYYVWEAEICGGDTIYYVTTTNSTFTTGDTVQTLWGETNFLCATLIRDVTGAAFGNTYFNSETKFNTCEDCYNTTIGLRTLNCFTLESEVIDLTYTAWTETTNYGGFNGSYSDCFLDSDGLCRTIVDVCPLPPVGNPKSVTEPYLNCLVCTIFNPIPTPGRPSPVSAGTEYFACQICCPCESGGTVTSVSVPHPVWTGLYGNSVTLLDGVQLGGMNGLNN